MITPTPAHLPAISAILAENGLPVDDLQKQDLALFLIELSQGELIGVGGLERCDEVALIRSVATARTKRGQGIAGNLIQQLEIIAVSEGLGRLYLLTETAELYFASKGYVPVDRANVPTSIKNSRQFSSLCSSSATVMFKRVGR
ncbi:MAG: GNAT family N-acetyltransferase [Alteromonadaceae bacterium]|nr:GNAT family N-acetyltransferase [Alteromonadaceae bacterium]